MNDRKAFDQAFGYDNKDVSEKAHVDAFWKSKRLDANSIYNSLATGATIPKESKSFLSVPGIIPGVLSVPTASDNQG